MKILIAVILLLFHAQSALANCADLNRQALPNKAALQAAIDRYKGSVVIHLRDMLNGKDPPPINAISEGIAETSKMITAMDKFISYLHSVKNAGCFGKAADTWSAAIIQMESQLAEMREDRKTYVGILSMMSKVEDGVRK